ncbi:MAG: hypothetical protein GX220_07440 [Treponema sp.]|nr:hypothetical protein [Treponema sp.]
MDKQDITSLSILPHRNICFELRQLQKKIPTIPFLPIFAPTNFETFSSPLFIHKPVFINLWLCCPVSKSENYFHIDKNKTISIASFLDIPINTIPLCFFKTKNEKDLFLKNDFKNFISTEKNFPKKMRVFRTAKINFSWPLDNKNIEKINEKREKKIMTQNLFFAFNWQIENAKWHH